MKRSDLTPARGSARSKHWPASLWLGLTALLSTGCFGTPTPLAPGISGSVGVPHHGVQTNGEELPRAGDGFVRYRLHGRYYWGNPRLISAIERIAAELARRYPDAPPLVLGDLSAEDGGHIPRHNSHRTGRDVDLLWLVTTPSGVPVKNPGFVRMGPDGLAYLTGTDGAYVRLDVDREWALLKAFLQAPEIDVQWMFCSEEVEALLIDYARARQEPPELVWRAENVLLQPGDSLAHDDHIHLRIACSPEEAVAGCAGGGPYWEWLPPMPALDVTEEWIYRIVREDPLPPEAPEEAVASSG